MVTFDVDGTLLASFGPGGNQFHWDAFHNGFREIFGVEASVSEAKHHGATDQLIAEAVLTGRGVSKEEVWAKMDAFLDCMREYAQKHRHESGTGLDVLPGVKEALAELRQRDYAIGLATGNVEEIAWMKLEAMGLSEWFDFGGFGSDGVTRTDVLKAARKKGEEAFGSPEQGWAHVGDAPSDIISARQAGAFPVGVATGIFSHSRLHEAAEENSLPEGSYVILPGLKDPQALLQTLNYA